jgi:AAHS family 4-hydroxybenzoate transporter-like MFS transporter
MSEGQVIDVARLVNERRVSSFNIKLLIICFFVILFDGYDITAIAFAGPSLIKQWGVTSMAAMGPVFSATLFGILFGSPIFGYAGDRWGRKIAIASATIFMGVFNLAAMYAGDLTHMMYLRFFVGIGVGGLMPNVIALNAEFAPKKFRATLVILMFTGITFGGGLPGAVAAWLLPIYGWQSLFLIGGALPILMGAIVAIWMPESIKFLALKTTRREEIARTVHALNPALKVDANTRFVDSEERATEFSPKLLFANGLAPLTVLLWVMFVCCLMSFYFVNSWLPTVLAMAHVPLAHAAIANMLFQFGGTLGGVVMSRPMDKWGMAPICIAFILTLVTVPWIGYASLGSEMLLMTVVALAGFTSLGVQFGVNALSAMMYPTSFRSSGSGWAFAIGRFGSVAGPIVAGFLIAMKLPIQHLFLFLLIPLAIGTIASLVMARLYSRRFEGMGVPREATMAAG